MIIFARVTEGAEPKPIFYRISENGIPEAAKAPESVADENRAKVLACLNGSAVPMSRAKISEVSGMNGETVKKHLRVLIELGKVTSEGENRNTVYRATRSPGMPGNNDEIPGESDVIATHLKGSWE